MARWGLNPITRKRLRRFRSMRRAWWSWLILVTLYAISLCANLIANDLPLWVRFEGRTYFPLLRFYPESTFTGERHTRPNYLALNESPLFADEPGNFMVFPPIPYSPHTIIPPHTIDVPDEVTLTIEREPRVGTLDFNADYAILRANQMAALFAVPSDAALRRQSLTDHLTLPENWDNAVTGRLDNEDMPAYRSAPLELASGATVRLQMSAFTPDTRPPRFLRVTVREVPPADEWAPLQLNVSRADKEDPLPAEWAARFTPEQQDAIRTRVEQRFDAAVPDHHFDTLDGRFRVEYEKEVVTYPFRPTRSHPLGLDASGRDVRPHILYALRTSMSFGLVLVVATMLIGILMGAIQGYFGGWVDITSQRLIEIWSALPFLYIIILLGSVYGRSFTLLLICYGVFNWIGISYYMRAEFLRLRKQPFVEAARVAGLKPRRIILKHILPNGLVPIITFFPFSLVGAIGSLAALDYLGFGLPATAPSWGALLAQAQEFRYAWWLVLYPSLALFIVILLGVFIGEGARSAFDPRADSRLE